jgi:hypothetical protein
MSHYVPRVELIIVALKIANHMLDDIGDDYEKNACCTVN